jgi:putative addiction module CopG family antidote
MSTGSRDVKILSIPVSGALERFIKERVSQGEYQTVSEYFRALVRADRQRAAEEQIEAKLIEALDSGKFEAVTPELFDRLRTRISSKREA